MLSSCVIVGKVVGYPHIMSRQNSKSGKQAYILVETDLPFRNPDGTTGKNVFKVFLWRGIAEECAEVCHPGMFVCIRGRLQSETVSKDGSRQYNTIIIAEKVVFQPES